MSFNILMMLFLILIMRQVIPESVPCVVHHPGHNCATLPTNVSLRSTNITWVANLYVKSNSKILICLRLEPQQSKVDVKLYYGQCESDAFTVTSFPKNHFISESSIILKVKIANNKAVFSISGSSSATSVSSPLNYTSDDFFICLEHQETVSAAFDCDSGCYIHSARKSPKTTKLRILVNSSTFFLHTLPDFKSLQFTAKFRNTLGGFPLPVTKTLKILRDNIAWNKIEVFFHEDMYRVHVNGHLALTSENYHIFSLAEVSVFVEGEAFYSLECKPQVNLKQLNSDSTEITKFTELNITSTAMTLPVTTVSVSPATNDTLTTLGTRKSFRFVLHIIFVLTVIIIVGSLVNLKLLFHLQQVRAV
ncbi:hypothetical protein OTU49_015277 [Cherax quadricarinatus]|uniref:Uncharacterized protein n=1 Tax=Cherax quadricarinatus TaxID=27406 RepID=A0AAW0YV95_CHEQU